MTELKSFVWQVNTDCETTPGEQRVAVLTSRFVVPGNNISARGVEALAEALLNANLTIISLDLTGFNVTFATHHMMQALSRSLVSSEHHIL